MIIDKLAEWLYVCDNLQFMSEVRLHADVILPMSTLPHYSTADFDLHCASALAGDALRNFGTRCTTMAVRIRRATALDDRWTRWPEYMMVSFRDTVPSAMAFRDSVSQQSAGSFTVRNAALSSTANETPWIEIGLGGPPCHRALDVMMDGCANLGIHDVETFIVDATDPFQCPEQWSEILQHLRAVRCIVMYGVRTFSSPKVLELARGLAQTVLHFQGTLVKMEYTCDRTDTESKLMPKHLKNRCPI